MWQTQGPHSSSAPLSVAFGKTPKMGDFLRVGSAGRAGECLDEWIQQGMAVAEAKRGPGWAPAYAAGAPWAFIFRPPRSANVPEGLVGVMKPSVDAVGRRFPLVVCAPALSRCVAPWPHVLPMVLGDYLDAAATVLLESDSVTSVADMQAALRRVPRPMVDDAEPMAREYEAWAASTPLQTAWAVIYGEHGLAVHSAMHTIVEAVAPFRGEEAPQTKLSLRLPLGGGGVAAAALWIDIVRQLARSLAEVRTCFWSSDGQGGSLVVQLGSTPPSTLAELWAPDPGSEYMCDLTLPSSVDVGRMLNRLPPHIAEVLQSPQALVQDLLGRLIS
jgi:type VI secretion system ImpM family protein